MQHNVIQQTLANGVSLILVPLLNTEAVTTIVLMGVGSRFESDAQRGLAHFTEHLVFKGGRKYLTAQAVAQTLDAVGGEFNAFTSEEFTGFYTKTDGRHLELGLDVLSDMVLHAQFPADELKKEKGVIAEEINMYEDLPMRKVQHVLSDLIFGDTPMGRAILGTKTSTAAFTRDDFVAYRKEFYKGDACTVVIAGALGTIDVHALVEKYFTELPAGQAIPAKAAQFQSDERVRLDVRKSEQTHLALAVKGYSLNDPKRYAFRMLTTILGGNMSSRLFLSVREEQGLCYYVRAYPDTFVDTGLLVCSAGVDNTRLPLAVSAIVAELKKLRDEPVEAEELQRAKQYLVGKMLLGLEDSEQVAEYYGLQKLLEDRIESPDEANAAMEAVTAAEVQEVAREIFTDEALRLAVCGPFDKKEELEKLMSFNA
jgi:predicted Zn-dependent peptidase